MSEKTDGGAPAMSHAATVRVRYKDTDQMGVVYYGNYFTYFEVGRTELLRASGTSYRDLEAVGVYLPVTETRCRYRRPARYDDLLHVETTVSRLSPARLNFAYTITRGDEEQLVEGSTCHAFVTADGRPVNLKKQAPELWPALRDAVKPGQR